MSTKRFCEVDKTGREKMRGQESSLRKIKLPLATKAAFDISDLLNADSPINGRQPTGHWPPERELPPRQWP